MSSLSFKERFKGRSGFISNYGSVNINPRNIINKARVEQLHPNTLKFTGNSIINPSYVNSVIFTKKSENSSDTSSYKASSGSLEPLKSGTKRKSNYSLITKKSLISVNKSFPIADYKPYTLKDYQNIKPKKYYKLGGLGPANVGTEGWLKKKEMIDKRWRYGNDMFYLNANKIPTFLEESSGKADYSSKVLKFAKSIVESPLR